MKRNVLSVAAIAEAGTGLALLIVPSLVGQLLLGQPLVGVALPVARIAGLGLLGLGLACWPGPARLGMLTYGAAVTVYLAYLGLTEVETGILLWPAILLHATLIGFLVRAAPEC